MTSICSPSAGPTRSQQLAMEAMLRSLLGANEYDRLCLGVRVAGVHEDVLRISVPTEECATAIENHHSDDFAVAAEYAFRLPIRGVSTSPAEPSESVAEAAVC